MPVNATPPNLTSETVLFANKAAAEAFFAAFSVPDASAATFGVVKKGEAVAYAFVPLVDSGTVIINLDGVQEQTVPTQAAFAELKASYALLAAAFVDLKQKLQTAEIISS